jgi:hypothetical protein
MVGEPVGKVAVAGRTEPGDNGGHAKNHHDHRPTNARICVLTELRREFLQFRGRAAS